MKVAIQGIKGSFHHQAAEKMLGTNIELVQCKSFKDVFDRVMSDQTPYGIVAVENSIHGSINAVYRLLARNSMWVAAETFLRIEQYLVGAPGQSKDLSQIKKVMSQAPALAQCEIWLQNNLPEAQLEETHDTAESIRQVASANDDSLAAIGGKKAAELYNGKIIAGPINDNQHNYTRFFLLTSDRTPKPGANKTSIILETGHQPGALYNALGVFAQAGINLSKLDSHPIASDRQHYAFYIDFEAAVDANLEHPVFAELRELGCKITVLGSYPAATPR